MGRRQSSEIGKREEILAAAQEIFLEKGFDGTSIRSIMKRAGGEIGLFYYYFKSKDEVFDCMLDRFFAGYEADFRRILAHGRRNPCRLMEDFFLYVERGTEEFRVSYAPRMHRTVRWAIREHTMEIVEPYVRQIVAIQSAYYATAPAVDADAAALYLTYGVCSSILHEDSGRYAQRRGGVKQGVSLLMGMPVEEQSLRIPVPAEPADLGGWLALAEAVQPAFAGLEGDALRGQLPAAIAAGGAWVVRRDGCVLAAALFDRAACALTFLAVRPEVRRRGLAGRLVETTAAQFPVGTRLHAAADAGADAFFTALGFCGGAPDACGRRQWTLTAEDRSPVWPAAERGMCDAGGAPAGDRSE